jgi:hypothetical protein
MEELCFGESFDEKINAHIYSVHTKMVATYLDLQVLAKLPLLISTQLSIRLLLPNALLFQENCLILKVG